MMDLIFVSGNEYKIKEAREILAEASINVIDYKFDIDELQTKNSDLLVKDKAFKAFQRIMRPLFVEHTGLQIEFLNQFPGGLTQIFWDSLKADKFSEILGSESINKVTAVTEICFIDGKKAHTFKGEIKGTISPEPKGDREFQWDCVFIPDTESKTFAELGPKKKNEISMRRLALDEFLEYLGSNSIR